MPTSRFCKLTGVPERSYRRWQAKARADRPPKGPWPQPARDAARPLATKHALAHPAWGHRKIWAMTRHDGHRVSQATVLRLLRDDGLILPSEYQKQRRELGPPVMAQELRERLGAHDASKQRPPHVCMGEGGGGLWSLRCKSKGGGICG